MTIAEKIQQRKAAGQKALAIFSTMGDPGRAGALDVFSGLGQWGADILELGIPYSDPLMDGPTLQRAYQRALKAGFRTGEIPSYIQEIRARCDTPMLVMTCFNPVFKYGVRPFFKDISSAGADAVLITDLPPEEWGESLELARSFGLGTILLVTPATPIKRMEIISEISEPFVYCVSKAGVTGEGRSLPPELSAFVSFVRDIVNKPLMIGFGISTPEHAKTAASLADGVIIGSAVAAIIERAASGGPDMLNTLERFVRGVRAAMDE